MADSTITSKEQVTPAFGVEGAESEADENHRGSHEGGHNDTEEKNTRTNK